MADQRTQIVISAKDETLAAFNSIKSNLSSIQTLFVGLGAAGLGAAVKSAADFADEIGKAAQKTGVTTEELSRLKYAADLSDVSFETLQGGIKKLSVNMAEAALGSKSATEAFGLLGISIRDAGGNMRSAEDVIADVADRFASMPDGVEKTALAVKVFGKSGAELIPLLNGGSAALKSMGDEAERFGKVVTKEGAETAAQFNDNLTRLGTALDGIKVKLAGPIIDALADITETMTFAAKEAGILTAAWVGLGGAMTYLLGVDEKSKTVDRLKEINAEIAKINSQIAGGVKRTDKGIVPFESADLQDRINTLKKLAEEKAQLEAFIQGKNEKPNTGSPTSVPKLESAPSSGSKSKSKTLDKQDLFFEDIALGKRQAADDFRELESNIRDVESAMKDLNDEDAKYIRQLEQWEKTQIDVAQADVKRAQSLVESIEPWQRFNREVAEYADLMNKGLITTDQFAKLSQEAQKEMLGYSEKVKETNSLAAELGATFSSAFEDAIVGGSKFSDVLKGLGQDIERLLIRRTITDPLMEGIDGLLGSSGGDIFGKIGDWFGGLFGGGKASGGYVDPSKFYLVGENGPELFAPGMAGNIIPNGALGGAGGGGVVVNLIEAPGNGGQVNSSTDTNGMTTIDIMVEQIEAKMNRNISRGAGIAPTLEGMYGLNRAVGAYR